MKQSSRYLVLLLIATLLVFFPLKASAQSGAYFGVMGGYSFSPDATWDLAPYSFDLDVKETWMLGFKIGYNFPQMKYFSVEFEYSYMNPDIDRTILAQAGSDFVAIEGDATLHNFMFNFIARYPEGKFHPYFGVGIGFSQFDVTGTLTGRIGGVTQTPVYDEGDDTPFAWQILAGIDFELNKNWTIDLGYRYFATNPDFSRSEIDYKTSMVTLGLKYYF